MALSDSWLKANSGKEREKREEFSDRDGLSVRVTTKGKITFQLRYRYAGKPARIDIGSYPLTTLKDARSSGLQYRAELEKGNDPRLVKKLAIIQIQEVQSFKKLFDQFYKSYCVKNKKNSHEIYRTFEIYVFPRVGDLPADEIHVQKWMEILEGIIDKGKQSIADRVLINSRQAYKWGIKRQINEKNPLSDISAKNDLQIEKKTGERTLSDDEIYHLWMAVENSRMVYKNKLFVKLCLFYANRVGELLLSEKEHFDFKENVWTIPPENHKMGSKTKKPLKRPIIEEIKPILEAAFELSGDSKYVFTKVNANEAMTNSSVEALPYNIMQWLRKNKGYEMLHWSMHDLRRTARTNFSNLAPPHIAEIILGHKLPGVWSTYDKYWYIEEQADCYKKWWDRLMGIVNQ